MITEKLYKDCVDAIVELNRYESDLYDTSYQGISLFDMQPVQRVKHMLEELLAYCTKDEDPYNPMISYFLYELECGDAYESGILEDSEGNEIRMESSNDLWDYLVFNNPDIVDISTLPKKELPLSEEEFQATLDQLIKVSKII